MNVDEQNIIYFIFFHNLCSFSLKKFTNINLAALSPTKLRNAEGPILPTSSAPSVVVEAPKILPPHEVDLPSLLWNTWASKGDAGYKGGNETTKT